MYRNSALSIAGLLFLQGLDAGAELEVFLDDLVYPFVQFAELVIPVYLEGIGLLVCPVGRKGRAHLAQRTDILGKDKEEKYQNQQDPEAEKQEAKPEPKGESKEPKDSKDIKDDKKTKKDK